MRYAEAVLPRALTTIVLLMFALGSGLNLDCLVRCAPVPIAGTSADCHQPTDSDLKLAASVDCADDQVAPSPALIAGRIVPASELFMEIAAETPLLPRHTSSALADSPGLLMAGPPHASSHTPLRI